MKTIIRFLVGVSLVFIYLIVLAVSLSAGIAIAVAVVIYAGYKLRTLPLKLYNVSLLLYEKTSAKYKKITPNLIPIQRKLLLAVIISGLLFLVTNSYSLIRFNSLCSYNDSYYCRVYTRNNFMIPHPSSHEYISVAWGFHTGWNWYSDKVFLTGLIFIGSLFFFLISIIISKVISEKTSLLK